MRPARYFVTACALLSLAWLDAGCARDRETPDYASAYRRLATGAVALYGEIEPLRSSRLGIPSSDSLLFTYSDDEIKEALKKLKRLETQFSRIPAGRLNAHDVDRATVIINWARGVRFALTEVESHRSNPLLYCWAAEEALRVAPARIAPPYEGELEAYRKRILRIPALLSNAEANLVNPAEPHVRRAIERLDSLEATVPEIAADVTRRYRVPLDTELGTAREAILGFRRYASETLLGASHGRLILGSENLSNILNYSELVNADPNMLAVEAKKQIKRLEGEKGAVAKRFELEKQGVLPARPPAVAGKNETFEARVERILKGLRHEGAEGPTPGPAPVAADRAPMTLRFPLEAAYVSATDRASCLSIPFGGGPAVAAVTPLSSAPPCPIDLALSARAARLGDDELGLALLDALPRMLEPRRLRCEARDTVAAVFSSATFAEGWRYLVLQELSPELKKTNPELYLLVVEDWIMKYARMIVVFSLHAGTMTSDAAAQYLAETTGLSREAAAREILAVSTSPDAAYPGISMLLVDEMTRNVSYVFEYGKPQAELLKLLRQWRDLPLSMIIPKTESD